MTTHNQTIHKILIAPDKFKGSLTSLQAANAIRRGMERKFLLPDNSPLFTPEQIEVMVQAVEDHRASSANEPRSIYGKIVAEADRIIDGPTIVRRTIQYGLSNYPHLNKEGHYRRFLEHMAEKYACGGYLKLWIPESPNAARLAAFQNVLEDPDATRNMFEEEWKKLIAR